MWNSFEKHIRIFSFFLCYAIAIQAAYAQGFVVNKAQVDIHISEEGYFDVVEDYDLTFTEHKHGIYRNIQTQYRMETAEGKIQSRKIKIRNIEVPGHKFTADFNFVQQVSDQLEIKIGDKDKTVIGPQHYRIKYRVYDAFLFEEDQIYFYWNVKPDGWNTTFRELNFTIHPPANAKVEEEDFNIYSGGTGTRTGSDDFSIHFSDGTFSAESRSGFKSEPGESVTVLLALPLGAVKEITPWWPFWTHYGWTLILGILVFVFFWIWKKFGKDDRVVTAISYFPPSGVDPAMAGFLIDDRADTPDLISLIPCWGSRGIIKMEQIEKSGFFGKDDTKLIRLRPLPADSTPYEEKIFNGLFGADDSENEKEVLISSLENSFYTTMASAKETLKSKAQKYYDPKAREVKNYTIIGVVFIGAALFGLFLLVWGIVAAFSVFPVIAFLLIMTPYLVKKNSKGNKVLSELKGFKQFIKVAEENKLKMLLNDSPNYFETTMAYALAFGLFDKWARKFEKLDIQPPSWYSSTAGALSMGNFSRSFTNSMEKAQTTMVSSPSSSGSGGGSAGGGFGGGGGGSW